MSLCVLYVHTERMTKEFESKMCSFFHILSSCENWVTQIWKKFLFSWIPLINMIILRCNMPMLWSKLKKLWVIQYFWSFTTCSHSNFLWLLFIYTLPSIYLSSSHPLSIHLTFHLTLHLFISLFISLNYLFISPISSSSQFWSHPSTLHLTFYLFNLPLHLTYHCENFFPSISLVISLFISPYISLFISLFISKLPLHLTHLSSHLSSHSIKKTKSQMKGEMKR